MKLLLNQTGAIEEWSNNWAGQWNTICKLPNRFFRTLKSDKHDLNITDLMQSSAKNRQHEPQQFEPHGTSSAVILPVRNVHDKESLRGFLLSYAICRPAFCP